jgi:hypothetical protein
MSENKAQCLVSKNKALRIIRGGTLQRIPDLWSSPLEKVSKVVGFRLVEEAGLESVEKQEQEPASGSRRVLRGGSLGAFDDRFALVAFRFNDTPGYRGARLGFRLVEEVIDE